ncbi:MAG: hypothetical protein AAGA09_01380 [Pseudomonadota bacterium]
MQAGLEPVLRKRLESLLEELERVQTALDEATLALEAVEAGAEPKKRAGAGR